MFEIYKAINGRKTYLVSNEKKAESLYQYAKKHFKVAGNKLEIRIGWILNDELYLEDPHKKHTHRKWIAYLK